MVCEVLYDSVMKELLDTIGERKNQWMDWLFDGCQTVCQCVGVSVYVRVFCQCMGVSVCGCVCQGV